MVEIKVMYNLNHNLLMHYRTGRYIEVLDAVQCGLT
jgi:hypothetical protein